MHHLQAKKQCTNVTHANPIKHLKVNPIGILSVGLVLMTTNNTQAEIPSDQTKQNKFYEQLHAPAGQNNRSVNNYLLNKVAGENAYIFNSQPDLISDEDLAFNYVWMQQYQSERDYTEGGAALGKLLRIGAKALYKAYNEGVNYENSGDDEISSSASNMDYRLRVSSDKVRFGFKYEF